jgi:hypothetical protein
MIDILAKLQAEDLDAIRVELAEGRRQLEGEHGPLLGTRFDLEAEHLEEYYADGYVCARRLSRAAAELAFETH